MRKLIVVLAAVAFCAIAQGESAPPTDGPPTEQSIDALLAAGKARQLIEKMLPIMSQSIQNGMKAGMNAGLKGQAPTADEQRILDAIQDKADKMLRDALSWDNLHPIYVQVYQETFTQSEVDGLVAFYQTPAGAAMIDKMPIVFQKTQALMQARMTPLIQQMVSEVERTLAGHKGP